MGRFIRTLLLILLTAVATVFFVQNLATIEVVFLTWSFAAPRALIFLVIFALGWAAAWLLAALRPFTRPKPPAPPPG